jgi:hypothetical protein
LEKIVENHDKSFKDIKNAINNTLKDETEEGFKNREFVKLS